MAFMRGSVAAMDLGAPIAMGAVPAEAGEVFMYPGLAQAAAREATDRATRVRTTCIGNS
jgi:hypothetical protein